MKEALETYLEKMCVFLHRLRLLPQLQRLLVQPLTTWTLYSLMIKDVAAIVLAQSAMDPVTETTQFVILD